MAYHAVDHWLIWNFGMATASGPYTLPVPNFKMDNRVEQRLPARVHQSPAQRQLRHVSSSSVGGDDGNGDIHAWLDLKIVALWVLGEHGEDNCAE